MTFGRSSRSCRSKRKGDDAFVADPCSAQADPAHPRAQMNSKTVLLVEDNPGDARLLRQLLNDEGQHDLQLIHVTSMKEAEERLAKNAFDIILLDLGLPDADGLGAVQRARHRMPNSVGGADRPER